MDLISLTPRVGFARVSFEQGRFELTPALRMGSTEPTVLTCHDNDVNDDANDDDNDEVNDSVYDDNDDDNVNDNDNEGDESMGRPSENGCKAGERNKSLESDSQ